MDDDLEYSVEGARAAAARDELGNWVSGFLASPGSDNAELADKLSGVLRFWVGPALFPLDRLNRLAGPADQPVIESVDEDFWPDDLDAMAQRIEDGWRPPPVIASWSDEQLVLEDGNHRVEALRRAGIPEAWVVVGCATPEERDRFVEESAMECRD